MRYRRSENTILLLVVLIIVILGIIFGFRYREELKVFIDSNLNKITKSEDYVSLDNAEEFFYRNKENFDKFISDNTQTTLYIDGNYISIIDRFDFGGNKIRAFRFQSKGDLGTEIIYSENELQESSILKNIEKHWYVYNYVNGWFFIFGVL